MELYHRADLTQRLKDMAPPAVRRLSRRLKDALRDWRNRRLSAQDVFTRIYAEKMWGIGQDHFYSGPGSDAEAAQPYADFVTRFIAEHDIRRVVDLGCGDFRVGQMIASSGVHYTGVDVVEALIQDNTERFGGDGVRFKCLDIAVDALPDGQLCLIREVFQHLSNQQIQAVLGKLDVYDFVLFTDVQPEDLAGYSINRDRVQGVNSRLVQSSCLKLEQPPFDVAGIAMVFETTPPHRASYALFGSSFRLRTFLWRPTRARARLKIPAEHA